VAKCQNNLRQIGFAITQKSLSDGRYPSGGTDPLSASLAGMVDDPRILECPAQEPDSPTLAPRSYIYLANLDEAYYECECSSCAGTDVGHKRIWKLYWSGVNYAGDHQQDSTVFKDLPLADNILFQNTLRANIDPIVASPTEGNAAHWEPRVPTVPVHQDTEKFHTYDAVKFRTQRALRMVPETPEDASANIPIAADACFLLFNAWADLTSQTEWWNYHRTGLDSYGAMEDHLRANHVSGSGSSKSSWGVNVLYADCSVRWKTWEDIRFQVLDPDNNRFFFY
jgi:hypothetical protein